MNHDDLKFFLKKLKMNLALQSEEQLKIAETTKDLSTGEMCIVTSNILAQLAIVVKNLED